MPKQFLPTITRIEVVESREIPDAIRRIAAGEIPGFQVDPKAEVNATKALLAQSMQEYVPGFDFTTSYCNEADVDEFPDEPIDETGHIDGQRLRGIALHVNHIGSGAVSLAFFDLEEHRKTRDLEHMNLSNIEIDPTDPRIVGPIHIGSLFPRSRTIFSEGFVAKHTGKLIHPAMHKFRSAEDSATRIWTRQAYVNCDT